MTVNDHADSLAHRDCLPFSWAPLAELPDAVSLERLAEANVTLLSRVQSLEERHRLTGDEDDLEQEIGRLHSKIDLLIAMVSEIARERLQLPPAVTILLSARTLQWSQTPVLPVVGAHVMVSIYLSPSITVPLRLPVLIESCDQGEVKARIEHPSESCHLALEQYVFLHHRRAVAETRNQSNAAR